MYELTPISKPFVEQFGALAFLTRLRAKVLMNTGGCMSASNAWLILRGMETLHVRMQRHCENASAIAAYLKNHPQVSWVCYPELTEHASHNNAQKYLQQYFYSISFDQMI